MMASYNRIEYSIHPLRETLYNELHIRPFYLLETPQQITHLAAACSKRDELDRAFDLICDLCRRYDVNQPQTDTVAFHQDFGDFVIHWERHVEFYALTILQQAPIQGEPFQYAAVDLLPEDWMKQLPGQMIAAFHIIIDDQQLQYDQPALARYFEGHALMASAAEGRAGQIYTAFKLHGDGYGRFILRNINLTNAQTGQLTRRLMDLETYRLLTLLSLPIAKKIAPQLLDMDQHLVDILTDKAGINTNSDERSLFVTLTEVEARLESHRAEANHRFSATRAYHQLVTDRLEGIKEERLESYLSLGEFINRRLNPALRTCESVQVWMDDLSRRIERSSELMRTRVNLNLQEQNRLQLAAMNRRGRLQFRLQETVEGLSIAAISYYAVGLLGYLLNGVPLEQWSLSKDVVLAGLIPLVFASVWFITRRVKKRLFKDQDDISDRSA